MVKFLAVRLTAAIPGILGVVVVVFFMARLVPGDPVLAMFSNQSRPSPAQRAEIRRQLGIDRPLHEQFVAFVADLGRGDLGRSFRTKRPVLEEIRLRVPNTLKLMGAGLTVTVVVGVLAGVVAASHKGTLVDLLTMLGAIVSVSIPPFWLGLMVILVFAVRLGWFPTSGADSWRHLMLPALTLGVRSAAVLARMTRSSMLDVLNQDYVRTARAKGQRELWVVYGHAFRNALIPIVTVLGFEIGGLLTGAFIIETVFGYPGLGVLAVNALQNRDFPLIQGIVLFSALTYVVVNLMTDVVYGALDPRVRYD